MRNWIERGLLLLALPGIIGCAKVDETVFLSVQMENNWDDHEKNPAKYADTGLQLFINGNFCQFLRFGSSAGAVDKFLMPGRNTLEVRGSTALPVEITICSFAGDHSPIRTILSQKWPKISTGGTYQVSFRVKKDSLLPIFDKKNVMPDRLRAEQEITAVVSNLYNDCITSNKEGFLSTTLEGYKIHSPVDYVSLWMSCGPMFDSFKMKPFPENLYFIHGSNLVFVYSGFSDFSMVLFPGGTKESGFMSGAHFAYIGNHWVMW